MVVLTKPAPQLTLALETEEVWSPEQDSLSLTLSSFSSIPQVFMAQDAS